MNCKQCGAPLTLYREWDYYHCDHCGVYHFPTPNPQGIRVLGENPEGMQCPLCAIMLNMITVDISAATAGGSCLTGTLSGRQ